VKSFVAQIFLNFFGVVVITANTVIAWCLCCCRCRAEWPGRHAHCWSVAAKDSPSLTTHQSKSKRKRCRCLCRLTRQSTSLDRKVCGVTASLAGNICRLTRQSTSLDRKVCGVTASLAGNICVVRLTLILVIRLQLFCGYSLTTSAARCVFSSARLQCTTTCR